VNQGHEKENQFAKNPHESCLAELNRDKEWYKAIAQRFSAKLKVSQVEKAKFGSSKPFEASWRLRQSPQLWRASRGIRG
jgi:hypothetical protein